MASGGKGGSTSSSVTIPDWIKEPAQRNLARAEQAAQVGYMPWYGPDVAAATPQQISSMQISDAASKAFGFTPQNQAFSSGLPTAQDFGGGVSGYSSAPLFNQALTELQGQNPLQFAKYNSLYNNEYLNQNPSTAGQYQVTAPSYSGGEGYVAPSNAGAWDWGNPLASGVGTTGSMNPSGLLGKLGETMQIGTGTIMNKLGINQQDPNMATVVDLVPSSYSNGSSYTPGYQGMSETNTNADTNSSSVYGSGGWL